MTKERYTTSGGIKVYCRYDAIVKISELKEHPKNPNRHPIEQLERLAEIYRKNGIRQPIKVSNLSGYIVAGHGRKKAAELAGIDEFPVEYQEYADEAAELADLIGDNRISELAEIDEKALLEALNGVEVLEMTGFTSDEITDIETRLQASNPIDDLDDSANVQEPIAPAFTQKGDVWTLGNHRLVCGDSTDSKDVDLAMSGDKADLVLTDPPYNINFKDKIKSLAKARKNSMANNKELIHIENDNLSLTDFCTFLIKAFKNIKSCLKSGRSFYIFFPDMQALSFLNCLKIAGLERKEGLIWVKNQFSLSRSDYHYRHEPIIYGWTEPEKGSGRHYFIDDRTQDTVFEQATPDFEKMKKPELIDWINNHILCDYDTIIRENKPIASKLHSTMKPIKLLSKLINNSSRVGDIIFEPFAGSGSTIIAADMTGRRARAIEINPIFCDVIVRRFALTIGKKNEITLERNGEQIDSKEFKHLLEEVD